MKSWVKIFLLISVLFLKQAAAQTPEIERLLKRSETAKGEERITVLSDISYAFHSVDPKRGIEYGLMALQLARSHSLPSLKSKIYYNIGANYHSLSNTDTVKLYCDSAFTNATLFKDSLQTAICYNMKGVIYESIGDFDSALFVFNKGLTLCRSMKNDEKTAFFLANIGTIYLNRGEFKSSLSYFLEAKSLYEKMNDVNQLPYIYLKIGVIYSESEDYAEALSLTQKGIDLSRNINDFVKVGMGLNSQGIILKKQGKYDQALNKFKEALNVIQDRDYPSLALSINMNFANVLSSQERFREALEYYLKSLDLAIQLKKTLLTANIQVNLGISYMNMKEFQKARSCFEQALPAFLNAKTKSNLVTTYSNLITVNDSLKDYKQSLKYHQLYDQIKDSLRKNELNTALDSLKVKFHTEETDKENLILMQENELQSKTISLQRTIMISSLSVVTLMMVLIAVIIRSRQKTKKANNLLEEKNLVILAKTEALQSANDKLLELSKFKDSMNSFLVHDLKNPLNAIINLTTRELSENQIKILNHTGKQMLNIVMNLLDISKYENNSMKISTEDVSLAEIIHAAFSDIAYLAEQKNIQLQISYTTDFILHVDPEIIIRVLENLLTNAIRFSSTGGIIRVNTDPINSSRIKIIVEDQGEGIDPEFLPRVFDKFSQAQGKKSRAGSSTGIGLAFCKMAVEAHTGEIGVESIQGQGATFWLTLPLADLQHDQVKNQAAILRVSANNIPPLQFSFEERALLITAYEHLKKLHISQLSDIKDIIKAINVTGSANITEWKLQILQAISNPNLEINTY